MSLVALVVFMTASSAHATTLAPIQVFTDGLKDTAVAAQATPPGQDLVAGFIGESDTTIDFTWQVADLPDPVNDAVPQKGVPDAFAYYWNFQIGAPGAETPTLFELTATPSMYEYSVNQPDVKQGRTHTQAVLAANCTTTGGSLITCTRVPGSLVTLSIDGVANTITAHVRRSDMRDASGNALAVDGSELVDTTIFNNIAGCTTTPVVTSGNMCDDATMDETYVLGTPRA
jgi:hypothetical protein